MAFKKLNEAVLEKINDFGFEGPIGVQKEFISKIKSGSNVVLFAEKDTGKTEAFIIAVLHKLQMKAQGDNPRVLIFVKDKQAALQLEERFNAYIEHTDLRISTVYEERIINHQKDEIYLGADIVIGTPKRTAKLYFLNGINLMELQLVIVEDAEFLTGTSHHTEIHRISQSVNRCQHVIVAEKNDDRIERLRDLIMENYVVVK